MKTNTIKDYPLIELRSDATHGRNTLPHLYLYIMRLPYARIHLPYENSIQTDFLVSIYMNFV